MKLKTLLLVVALLCVSLFVVACGGGDDTTEAPGTDAPGATTTEATTTKKVTSNRCTTTKKTTTTTAATTLSPDFFAKLPAKLPNNQSYEVAYRFGMESDEEFLSSSGNYGTHSFTTEGAVFGNAIKYNSLMTASGSARRNELYMDVLDSFEPTGLRGVMWYIDFTGVSGIEGKLCSTVCLNKNGFRSAALAGVEKSGIGYYLKDGEWVQTAPVNGDRMGVPVGFKGWMYVPITSYLVSNKSDASGVLFDPDTGLGISGQYITGFRVYSDGYEYGDDAFVLADEVLFLK